MCPLDGNDESLVGEDIIPDNGPATNIKEALVAQAPSAAGFLHTAQPMQPVDALGWRVFS